MSGIHSMMLTKPSAYTITYFLVGGGAGGGGAAYALSLIHI